MSSTTMQKTLHYRRAELEGVDGKLASSTLQDLLEESIISPEVTLPIKMNAGGNAVFALSTTQDGRKELFHIGECTCGWICRYTPGRKVPLTDSDEKGTYMGTGDPIDDEGIRRNLLESYVVFAIKDNHVALLQSQNGGDKDLALFLHYLIQNIARTAKCLLDFVNLPSNKALHKINLVDNIKEFAFSSMGFERPRTRTKHYCVKPTNVLISWLNFLGLGNNKLMEDIESGLLDPGQLRMGISIAYDSRSGGDGRAFVAAMAAAAGHVEGIDPTITLKDGTVIKGEELTIKEKITVKRSSANDDNINYYEAVKTLAEWLTKALKDGKIPQ